MPQYVGDPDQQPENQSGLRVFIAPWNSSADPQDWHDLVEVAHVESATLDMTPNRGQYRSSTTKGAARRIDNGYDTTGQLVVQMPDLPYPQPDPTPDIMILEGMRLLYRVYYSGDKFKQAEMKVGQMTQNVDPNSSDPLVVSVTLDGDGEFKRGSGEVGDETYESLNVL